MERKQKSSIKNKIFFVHHRRVSTAKRVDFVSDKVSYIVLRGRRCNIIVVNEHGPSDDKRDDSKDSFFKQLGQDFYHFPKYHVKILSGDFNVKLERGIYSNRQLGMRVYIRIVKVLVLE
jgi:hypothetical protein